MKAQFVVVSKSLFVLATDGVSAWDGFKAIFNKYFKSFDIQPRSAQGIEEITVYKTTAANLAAFEAEALAAGVEFKEVN